MDPISVNKNTQLGVTPSIDDQLIGMDDDCLIIQHFNVNLLIAMGWGGSWLFWICGLPMALYSALSPWMPPYGYNEDNTVATFSDVLQNMTIASFTVYILFFIILSAGLMLAMTLGFSYFNLRAIKKTYSPITFNRKTQTVSIYHGDEIEERPWEKLGGTIEKAIYTSGFVVHSSDVLRLHALGHKTQIAGGLVGKSLDGEKHVGAESVWEFIRQFMEDGPDDLLITAIRPDSLNQIDKQPMYSFNFKESLRVHWVSSFLTKKSMDVADWIVAAILIPIKLVFFIPNIFADWLWRKLCLRVLKTSKVTPQYSLKQCDNPITTADSESVLKEGENLYLGLSYKEIRRRLNELS